MAVAQVVMFGRGGCKCLDIEIFPISPGCHIVACYAIAKASS